MCNLPTPRRASQAPLSGHEVHCVQPFSPVCTKCVQHEKERVYFFRNSKKFQKEIRFPLSQPPASNRGRPAPDVTTIPATLSIRSSPGCQNSSLLTPHSSLLSPVTPHSSLLTPHSSLPLLTPHSSVRTPHASLLAPSILSPHFSHSSFLTPHASLLSLLSLLTPHS